MTPDSGGTTCGNCILNSANGGASFVSQPSAVTKQQLFGPNFGGCIALTDKTNGAACEQALDADTDCDGFECADCSSGTAQETCDSTVEGTGGSCATFGAAELSGCPDADLPFAADGGVNSTAVCFPSEVQGATDSTADFTYIINLICGSGDGG
jgi:hypothetical protein